METNQQQIICPMCGSTSLSANKKGYDGNKGSLGMALVGTSGLALGMKGMNDIEITCLNCSATFKPGEGANSMDELESKKQDILNRKNAEQSSKNLRLFFGILLIIIVCIILYNNFSFLF